MGAYSVHTTYKQTRCHTLKANMSVIVFLHLQSCDVMCAYTRRKNEFQIYELQM